MSDKMEIGALGSPNITFRRKMRWTLEGEFPNGNFQPQFVKVNSRPTLDIEELELNFLSAKTWNPNKPTWSETTTTFLEDCNSKELAELFSVLSKLNEEMKFSPTNEMSFPDDKKGMLKLKLYDCGIVLEEWHIHEAFPVKLEFEELSHDPSDPIFLEVTWRYDKVIYKPTVTPPTTI